MNTVEIAYAQVQRPGKGEDAFLVRPLDAERSRFLLAVADGLTMNGGKAAANWAVDCLKSIATTATVTSAREVFGLLKAALISEVGQYEESETTLTCGILTLIGDSSGDFLRFDFFAIGDSPIWKVILGEGRYPYQRMSIHGGPYPAETARVYATLRLHMKDIKGLVTFGSVDVVQQEVLVVCSDGIPEREVFVRDLTRIAKVPSDPNVGLCQWFFRPSPYRSYELADVLDDYDRSGALFDDATIIVARLVSHIVLQDKNFETSNLPVANVDQSESVASPLSTSTEFSGEAASVSVNECQVNILAQQRDLSDERDATSDRKGDWPMSGASVVTDVVDVNPLVHETSVRNESSEVPIGSHDSQQDSMDGVSREPTTTVLRLEPTSDDANRITLATQEGIVKTPPSSLGEPTSKSKERRRPRNRHKRRR